jgi:hypothetical protein
MKFLELDKLGNSYILNRNVNSNLPLGVDVAAIDSRDGCYLTQDDSVIDHVEDNRRHKSTGFLKEERVGGAQ